MPGEVQEKMLALLKQKKEKDAATAEVALAKAATLPPSAKRSLSSADAPGGPAKKPSLFVYHEKKSHEEVNIPSPSTC